MLLKEEEKNFLTGLLGTIAVHLVILIIFLIARLDKVRDVHQEPIVIEFDEQMAEKLQEMVEAKKALASEPQPLSDEEVKNIAVNTANQVEEEISTEKYIEQLKEELDIDDLYQNLDRSLPEDLVVKSGEEKEQKEAKKKRSYYDGPTRISYNLENRTDRYIHVPVYICQGNGKVVVNIVVNPEGEVISTEIASANTKEPCILETALQSASISKFNIDLNAEQRQKGTISYEFVAQ